MLTSKIIKHSLAIFVGGLAFAASSFFLSSCEKGQENICVDMNMECNKTPFSYKVCEEEDGDFWIEINGIKYYNEAEAAKAYNAYCGK